MTSKYGVHLSRIAPRIHSLAETLSNLSDVYLTVVRRCSGRSAEGSAARLEEDATIALSDDPWTSVVVEEAHGLALSKLHIAQECLQATGILIDEGGVIAPWSVGRTVVEVSAAAFWLLDESIPFRRSVARAFVDQLISIDYRAKMPTQLGTPDLGFNSDGDSVIRKATDLGFSVHENPRSVGGEKRPSYRSLVAQIYGTAGLAHYNLLSSFAHGEFDAFADAFRNESHEDISILMGALTVSGFLKAVERQLNFYGWESPEFYAQKAQTISTINGLTPGQWKIDLPYFDSLT